MRPPKTSYTDSVSLQEGAAAEDKDMNKQELPFVASRPNTKSIESACSHKAALEQKSQMRRHYTRAEHFTSSAALDVSIMAETQKQEEQEWIVFDAFEKEAFQEQHKIGLRRGTSCCHETILS